VKAYFKKGGLKMKNLKSNLLCQAAIFLTIMVSAAAGKPPQEKSSGNEAGNIIAPQVLTQLQNSSDSTAYVIVGLKKPIIAENASLEEKRIAIRDIQTRVLTDLAPGEFRTIYRYDNIASITGFVNEQGLAKLAANPLVSAIGPDAAGQGHLSESVPFIHADDVHSVAGLGYTGEGITVAVLDTGIDSDHPDLKDNIASGWYHFLDNGTNQGAGAEDDVGHGTNVAGIITSKGIVAPIGVAPDADILAIKVLKTDGHGGSTGWASDWTKGVDYVVTHRSDYDALYIINMSLGTNELFTLCPCDNYQSSNPDYQWLRDLRDALNAAKNAGIVTFVSSGNNGSCTQMPAPACLSAAVPVAAVYDQNLGREPNSGTYYDAYGNPFPSSYDDPAYPDLITRFSNRNGNNELAAPGRNIKSCGMGGGTSEYTGTSQASPHCAAVAALICEKIILARIFDFYPTPNGIVNDMKNYGHPTTDLCSTSPNPVRIDAFEAVNHAVPFEPFVGYKYKQKPNTTGYSIDVRCDRLGGVSRILADDFVCNFHGPIKRMVLFASFLDDFQLIPDYIYLRIYDDIPDPDGDGPGFSKPGNLLWQASLDIANGDFTPSDFDEIPPFTIPAKAWWWDPAGGQAAVAGNDKKTMRIDILLPPDNYFVQQGAPCGQKIYWLAIYANYKWVIMFPAFGWKTATTSKNDAAVWSSDNGSTWNKLTYPAGHPSAGLPIDFSFRLFGNVCCKSVDYDSDGNVDFKDFAYFADDWGWAGDDNHSDLNCDYVVNFTDLAVFCVQWLNNCTYTCLNHLF
jgi:subtilisin family serine protease